MCLDGAGPPAVLPPPRGESEPPEPLPLRPIDGLRITSLVDNVVDLLAADQGVAHRSSLHSTTFPALATRVLRGGAVPDGPLAEHGFSALVELTTAGREHRVLFDAGVTPHGLVRNMRRLGLSPSDIDVVVLSHGHFDHTTGLDGFIQAVGRTNLPVLIHPQFWRQRRVVIEGRDPIVLPSTSRRALEDAGFGIIERPEPSFLLDGALLVTGEVDRTTGFERGMPNHQANDGSGWSADPLVLDDQALIAHVRGQGLVVLTGCGHAGIVNLIRYARRLTGVDRLHAVLGGFHLTGAGSPSIIRRTVEELRSFAPDAVVPAHCTGFAATHAIAAALPQAFIANSVGTRYDFTATSDASD